MNYKLFVPLFLLLFLTLSVSAQSIYSTPSQTGTSTIGFANIVYPAGSYYKRIVPLFYIRGTTPDAARYESNTGIDGWVDSLSCFTHISSATIFPGLISVPYSYSTYMSTLGLFNAPFGYSITCPCLTPYVSGSVVMAAGECLQGAHIVTYQLIPSISVSGDGVAYQNIAESYTVTVTRGIDSWGTTDISCAAAYWGDGSSTTFYSPIVPSGGSSPVQHYYTGAPGYYTQRYKTCGLDTTGSCGATYSAPVPGDGCAVYTKYVEVLAYVSPNIISMSPSTAQVNLPTTYVTNIGAGTHPITCTVWHWGDGTAPTIEYTWVPGPNMYKSHTYTSTGTKAWYIKTCDTTAVSTACTSLNYITPEAGCVSQLQNVVVSAADVPPTAHTVELDLWLGGIFTPNIYTGVSRDYSFPYTLGTYTWRCNGVDWGDGSAVEVLAETATPGGSGTPGAFNDGVIGTHTYATAGVKTITSKVCDSTNTYAANECANILAHSGCSIETTPFTVYGASPSVTPSPTVTPSPGVTPTPTATPTATPTTTPGYEGAPCLTSHDCHVGYKCNEQYLCTNMQRWAANAAQGIAETTFPFMELGFVVLIISFAVYMLKHNSEAE